jgi:hypothetical protein
VSERDAEHRVVAALEQRGFSVKQDFPVAGAGRKVRGAGVGRVDIFAQRGDVRLVVEMKRPDEFRTAAQRGRAVVQANRYADRMGPLYVATSDGDTLVLEHGGERHVHQLVGGVLLEASAARSPLDVGADYAVFAEFPRLQREPYVSKTEATVERDAIFDLEAFLAGDGCDAVLVAGEAGAGKTTYAQQLASHAGWDPVWLDGGTIDDPRDALERAVRDDNGFTGDVRAFLSTLQGYRRRDEQAPCGIVIDALDEWPTAQRHLPDLLAFAKDLSLKVVVFGRSRSVDALLENERLARGLVVRREELHAFSDDERERAEATYVERYDLRSGFCGRAKEMSRLPEMMGMISAAYAGEAVNPDLTESELYERYRAKKCADVARRTGTDPAIVQSEIDTVARTMLQADAIALPIADVVGTAAHLDGLLSSGVLRNEGGSRNARVRFRFGRIRDDALAASGVEELFASAIVGRSALDYASATDASIRRAYFALAVREDVLGALFLARETGWWRDFAAVVPSDISPRERSLVLGYAGANLADVPELLDRFAEEPHAARLAYYRNVDVSKDTWRGWVDSANTTDAIHDVVALTRRLLTEEKIGLDDAMTAVKTVRPRLLGDRGFTNEGHTFWPLVGAICDRLDVVDARRFLRAIIPTFAVAHSSGGAPMGSHYHGVTYSADMLKCVEAVRVRSSAGAFEAWASAFLLRAYATEWREYDFDGREITGSSSVMGRYDDNGWVLDAVLPATQALVAKGCRMSERLKRYRISRLHPAFRLRAMILAAPIAELERLAPVTLRWRRDRDTGIPALADALDARAPESHLLRLQSLDDALERFGMPISAAQSDEFHKRLASGDRCAARQAERFVADPRFHGVDAFNVEFFKRLDWAQRRPLLAAKLVRIAILSGYGRFLLGMQRGYGDVMRLAASRPRVRRILADVPGITDEIAMSLRTLPKPLRARVGPPLYDQVGLKAKREIVHWSHELRRPAALLLLRRALTDDCSVAEECSGDEELAHGAVPNGTLHDEVWSTIARCHRQWPKRWFRDLGVDLLELAARFQSPVGVAATVPAIAGYAFEMQRHRPTMERVIGFLFDAALKGGPNLRELVGSTLARMYGIMTGPQRSRFFNEFAQTETVALGALQLARNHLDDAGALDRALAHARSSPHRPAIAGTIWRGIKGAENGLTPVDRAIVEELVAHADEATVREVAHVATSLSRSEPILATELLLRIVARALAIRVQLWTLFEMEYDWRTVSVRQLDDLVASAVENGNAGFVEVDVIARGLASHTAGSDSRTVQDAFERLSRRYEGARELFTQWRRNTAMG